MDEPTVGIDPQSRNHILQSVKQLNSMGCTIIYTSHYMEEVEEICSRIGIIDHGKLIAEGTNDQLKSTITEVSNYLITVSSTKEIREEELKTIQGVISTSIKGNNIGISSWKRNNNLNDILAYLMRKNVQINNIQSKIPDLETVFLNLTGRNLRD